MEWSTSTAPAPPGSRCGATLYRAFATLGSALLSTVLLTATAQASPAPPLDAAVAKTASRLDTGSGADAPRQARTGGRALSYATVHRVNRDVNTATRYVSDEELYGRPEHWTIARGAGDCEDYALAKRAALLAAGADPAHLRLATAWIASGEYHLVLIATTDRGEYVLDARHPFPMVRQDLEAQGYRWHLVEEAGRWFAVL
ncbi:transglutaminase-like cysteine peptidase [Caldimonas tepidiphila]|uniref:transglutaminase-like cysteine peptidase n=1 Tax=Caldimonas tepidiphila TaxID=2315841 RepID=UPI000E5BF219|nr:transglutaminase-like cysteine peptidase [Caldimonas tepidiphila]